MFGSPPKSLGLFELKPTEFQYVMYMPIMMPGGMLLIPPNLLWAAPVIVKCWHNQDDMSNKYMYITAKHFFVEGTSANRPGWHADGFGTDDVNYIWASNNPTEFCIQDFDLDTDHEVSMMQMEHQAKRRNIRTYRSNELLRLDQEQIHRVPVCTPGVRSFVKISVSNKQYALEGNAKNPLLDYDWAMSKRSAERNDP